MITAVRFPHAVEVLKGEDSRSTWQVGLFGIVQITREESGVLVFELKNPGMARVVYPPQGTVVDCEAFGGMTAVVSPVAMDMAKDEAANGPTICTPSADPPRAKPIKTRR